MGRDVSYEHFGLLFSFKAKQQHGYMVNKLKAREKSVGHHTQLVKVVTSHAGRNSDLSVPIA